MKLRILSIALVLLFLTNINEVFGQKKPTITYTSLAAQYQQKIEIFLKENQYDSAHFFLDKKINLSEQHQQWRDYIQSRFKKSYVLFPRRELEALISNLNDLLPYALEHLSKSDPLIPDIHNMLARAYNFSLRRNKAVEILLEGLTYEKYAQSEATFFKFISSYRLLVWVYYNKKDYSKAQEYLEQVFILSQTRSITPYQNGWSYLLKGMIAYEQKKYVQAKEALLTASDFFLLEDRSFAIIEAYSYLADIHSKELDDKQSLYYLNLGLKRLNEMEGELDNIKRNAHAILYSKISTYHFEKEEYQQALGSLQKMLLYLDEKLSTFGQAQLQIAETYLALQQPTLALHHLQKGIISVSNYFKNQDIYSNPNIQHIKNPNNLIKLLTIKSKAFEQKYAQSKKNQDLQNAWKVAYLAVDVLGKLLKEYSSDDSKIVMTELLYETYQQAFSCAVSMYHLTADKLYQHKAFEISERSKAVALYASIQDLQAKDFANIPDSLLQYEKELKTDIAYYTSQLDNSKDASLKTQVKNKLFVLNRQKEKLITDLETNFPKYHHLKYDLQPVCVNRLQNKLDKTSSLVEYFITKDSIYSFVVEKSSFHMLAVAKGNLDENLKVFRKTLDSYYYQNLFKEYKKLAVELYQQLFEPLLPNLHNKRVIIIPDAGIATISFDALIRKPCKSEIINYKNLAYLVHEYAFSYAPSATLFNTLESEKTKPYKEGYIAFAPSFDDVALRALPEAEREVKQLDEHFQGIYFIGEKATESLFKSITHTPYAIIHLATHGSLQDSISMQSKIVFAPSQDNKEDNYLYTHELYGLDLSTELLFLGACNTGRGKVFKGEGVLSFSRSAFYAGCQSIIMSLWAAFDEGTANISDLFYASLAAGIPKDVALQKAKIAMLQANRKVGAHPCYWAYLSLWGSRKPVIIEQSFWKTYRFWLWGTGLLVVLIGLGRWFWRR